jgi:serine/threonine-protein kinase RsbW
VTAIALSSPVVQSWKTLTFSSTLFLQPVLDALLSELPEDFCFDFHYELRLGLQEALVNAAKHGNNLNPEKSVVVRYSSTQGQFWWVIVDQGCGFEPAEAIARIEPDLPPPVEAESGRGIYILYQVFDQVYWNLQGTELSLFKHFQSL